MRILWTAVVVAAVLLTCVCGCSERSGMTYMIPESAGEGGQEPGQVTPGIETGTADAGGNASEAMRIETRYGDLCYPVQWGGVLEVDRTADGDAVTVSFRTSVRGVQYTLFDITIGKEVGTLIGNLTDENGVSRPVYARMAEVTFPTDFTVEEQDRLYSMQEDLNFLMENLRSH